MTNLLPLEGHRIAYALAGSSSNPPIIFVHGLMSHRGVWNATIEKLKDRFFCVSFDLLGFGDSDKPNDGDYTIAKQAERVLQVANHFGLDTFIVTGHSMGGQIAAYITAILAPQRVKKLIFIDGVVTGRLADHVQNVVRKNVAIGEKFPIVYRLGRVLVQWKPIACWQLADWFYKPAELPFALWERDRRMAMNYESARVIPKSWDSLNATDLTPYLKDIAAPTLIIFGKQDGTVPVEQAYFFKERCPDAQLIVFDECGHFPMYEKFDPYIAALENFFKT